MATDDKDKDVREYAEKALAEMEWYIKLSNHIFIINSKIYFLF